MSVRVRLPAVTLNPILVREVRARWRGWHAFILLFGYAILFAVALGYRYGAMTQLDLYYGSGVAARISAVGRDLFAQLTWIQTLGWILIAPSLTATSIAGERERGLLEALQLSPLTPWRIVCGKLLSAFSLIFLLLLVPLPISALCFMMGGVSGGEFLQAFALHCVTAVTGAAIGLCCSAWHRRANTALRSVLIVLLTWGVGSWIALQAASAFALAAAMPLPPGFPRPAPTGVDWGLVCSFIGQTHPIIGALSVFDFWGFRSLAVTALPVPPPFNSPWAVSIVFQTVLSIVLLWAATRAVRRPLRETYWLERKRAPQAAKAKTTARQGVLTGRREVPLARLFQFSNPVLRRETYAKFRLRRSSSIAVIFEILLSLLIVYLYLSAMWWIVTDKLDGKPIWQGMSMTGVIAIMIGTALMGAGSFTREREAGTWESLRLSLLSPVQVIAGKLLAPLIACVGYSMIAWPLLLACIIDFTPGRGVGNHASLGEVIGTALILLSTAWCYTAWGMLFSWWCRRTIGAISWTLTTLFFVVVFVPVVLGTMIGMPRGYGFGETVNLLQLWHPLVAIGRLNNPTEQSHALIIGLTTAIALTGLGTGVLTVLYVSMRRQVRK